jgi:hypothetical protein
VKPAKPVKLVQRIPVGLKALGDEQERKMRIAKSSVNTRFRGLQRTRTGIATTKETIYESAVG